MDRWTRRRRRDHARMLPWPGDVDECTEQASMLHADHLHLSRIDRASRAPGGRWPGGMLASILAVGALSEDQGRICTGYILRYVAPFKMRIPICAVRLHPTYEVTADALARW